MVARVARDFWTNPKRLRLERELRGKFAKSPRLGSMCAGECVCLIWAWLDGRNCPRGSLTNADAHDLEDVARWPGDDGKLWAALVSVNFIVPAKSGDGLEWNDFQKLNGDTIRKRVRRVSAQDGRGDGTGDASGDGSRDKQGDEKRGLGSGFCIGSSSGSSPHTPVGAHLRKARRMGRRQEPADRNPSTHKAITAALIGRGWSSDNETFREVVERSPMSDDELLAAIRGSGTMGNFLDVAAPWMNGAA